MKSNTRILVIAVTILGAIIAAVSFYRIRMHMQQGPVVVIGSTEDVKGLGYSGQRKIAVDSHGNIFVAFRKKYQGKDEIFAEKMTQQNGTWKIQYADRPIAIIGSLADQRVPSIAIDANDRIHVVWYGSDATSSDQENNRQIKYVRSDDGGATWSSPATISRVDGYTNQSYWQEHPYILAGSSNELYVVWEGKDQTDPNQQIKFSRSSDNGTTWSAWKNVKPMTGTTQSRPVLVQDKNGNLLLFMYSSGTTTSTNQQIQYAVSSDNGNAWNNWKSISDPKLDSRHESVVIDSKGMVHVAWRQWDSNHASQIMYRSLQNNVWFDPLAVAASTQYQLFPDIGIDPNEKIIVSWMETGSSSQLPNEDPAGGIIYTATLSGGSFSKPNLLSTGTANLYPHLPAINGNGSLVPLVYESSDSLKGGYDVVVKWVAY